LTKPPVTFYSGKNEEQERGTQAATQQGPLERPLDPTVRKEVTFLAGCLTLGLAEKMGESMNREKWGSLIWLGAGIGICIGTFNLSLGTMNNPGPGMFPFAAGAILAILSSILLFQSITSKEATTQQEPFFVSAGGARNAGLVLIALLAYAFSMDYLGFVISTTLFLAFLLWAVEPQRWYIVVFGSLFAALLAYTVFKVMLDTSLPAGLFGF
jgi:putative tricarboxylic transport membrane protein